MVDKVASSVVVCQGGLNSTENYLLLDATLPGGAARLVNYEVGIYGGYRRIEGFVPYSDTYEFVDNTNAEGKILGLVIYTDIDDSKQILAARKQKSGNTYNWYKFESGTGWVAETTGCTLNTASLTAEIVKIRHAKVSFGNVSYLVFADGVNNPTVYDGTDWYQLDPTGAGTSVDPGGNQLLSAPSYVTTFENHIFFSGDAEYPALVCHSAPEDVFDYTVASGGGQLLTGYKVKQIKPFRENLFVFGTSDIKKIYVNGTDFVIKDVTNNIGTIASDSVLEINGDLIFLAQDGVRTVSGTDKIGDINIGSLSRQILHLINDVQNNYNLDLLNGVIIKKKSQFRYFVSASTLDALGKGIIGGIRDNQGQASWEFGELAGIVTSVVENDYISNQEVTLHGNFDGGVYQQESGDTFNGVNVTSVYTTTFLTLGDPLIIKQSRKLRTFMKPEGPITLNIRLSFDWDDDTVRNPDGYTTETNDILTYYDDGIAEYDDTITVYDVVDTSPIKITDIQGSWRAIQITYTSSGDYAPHSIQGFIIDYTPQGTRP